MSRKSTRLFPQSPAFPAEGREERQLNLECSFGTVPNLLRKLHRRVRQRNGEHLIAHSRLKSDERPVCHLPVPMLS